MYAIRKSEGNHGVNRAEHCRATECATKLVALHTRCPINCMRARMHHRDFAFSAQLADQVPEKMCFRHKTFGWGT